MQKKTYKEDQGLNFGNWNDKTSQFLYYESLRKILFKVKIPEKVADYGGANGNLKTFIPNSISIDIDPSKKPDIIDNIITHKGEYELIVIRFVLHYLNDYEVLELFQNIAKNHTGQVLIVQFCNNDLRSKYLNSVNEFKYFRTEKQFEALIPRFKKIYTETYRVGIDFYMNRLGLKNAVDHEEILNAYLLNYKKPIGDQK